MPFLRARPAIDRNSKGPWRERVAGYLNGDGGSAFGRLSTGPGHSEKVKIAKGVHGWRKWQDI